ncbi:hypothetical protein [Ralstonia chuxiongensis]|uniref:Uncharacterized protein n=1 Tax=Ralstonia chuxiongensis TaxID=2957504 RepID=A0AA42BI91_9RALS|nr:hypothetical protein [Ralstonia chuxiongensis]MCP1173759.1 hypothetical protein [Ralstonia chuxiongensis]
MKTHQQYGTREYQAWANMKARCENPNNIRYHRYGGRGIKVCERWRNSFEAFLADMGPSNGLTIDRIDNDGNYEPGNCRWATVREQSQKTSRIKLLTFNGETLSLAEWARRLGIRANTLTMRLNAYKWPLEKALTKGGER